MRALVTALIMILMVAGSTATSPLFVIYREQWGITSADIAIVFSVYVGTLLPVLLFFGGLAERFGRRPVAIAGILSMFTGLAILTFAHGLPMLILARLFQGAGVGISVGALSAALTESYKGKLPIGTVLQSVASIGLFTGPVISAIAYNLGGGVNLSYVPTLVFVASLLGLVPFIVERPRNPVTALPSDVPFAPEIVTNALRLALPVAFVSWAGLSLFLSLVPSYLAATLHASNPAIGAAAVLAAQVASLTATFVLRNIAPERGGTIGSAVSIVGLMLLVWGTSADIWPVVALATLLVGGGAGIASAAAFGIASRIGRGHRAKVYARMYVAAYAGYSIPALAIGLIAVHTGFAPAFILVTGVLAAVTAALPFLGEFRIDAFGRNRELRDAHTG
jgi:Major Facilitator Superfamily